jgi:AraC-like DNA-binding protein
MYPIFICDAQNKTPNIPLMRAAYLHLYLEYLGKLGISFYDYIMPANLPSTLGRDDYAATMPVSRFLDMVAQTEGIRDLGFQATKELQVGCLHEKVLHALDHCPTLYERLEKYSQLASWECTHSRIWLTWHGPNLRVNSTTNALPGLGHAKYLQWLQNMMVICIVRQFSGPRWCPAAIAFQSRFMLSEEAQAFFPGTRFLTGEKNCWIDIPAQYLTLHRPELMNSMRTKSAETLWVRFIPDFLDALRILIRPYFNDGYPKINLIAKAVGLSSRTLQRHLETYGTTYSKLVQQIRLAKAMELLSDSQNSITEIAHAVGYSDHSHFTRAFRRVVGTTPQSFRKQFADDEHQVMASSLRAEPHPVAPRGLADQRQACPLPLQPQSFADAAKPIAPGA